MKNEKEKHVFNIMNEKKTILSTQFAAYSKC